MTRKRLRYSDLSAPTTPPAAESGPAETIALQPEETRAASTRDEVREVAGSATDAQAPRIAPSVAPPAPDAAAPIVERPPIRARRNSTPVELARTLTAERAAAAAAGAEQSGQDVEMDTFFVAEPEAQGPYRSLRERARMHQGTAELLMFRVGGERFAVELILVDEVIDLPVIHHVPEMPPAMLGVVTVRGTLTPVYSPRQAFGLPLALRDAVLIFRRGDQRVGILIDDVDDAITIDMREMRDTPGGDDPDSVLLGVVRLADTLVGIVDSDALIMSCQSAALLEVA